MNTYYFTVNNKLTTWQKMEVSITSDSYDHAKERIIALAKEHPLTLENDKVEAEIINCENNFGSEEHLSVSKNHGCSTTEILDDKNHIIFENGKDYLCTAKDNYAIWYSHAKTGDIYYIIEYFLKGKIQGERIACFSQKEVYVEIGTILLEYNSEESLSINIISVLKETADCVPLETVLRCPKVYAHKIYSIPEFV